MTRERKVVLGLSVVVLAIIAVWVVFAVKETKNRDAAQAYATAKDEQIRDLKEQMADRDTVWSKRYNELMKQKAKVVTIHDAQNAIRQYAPEAASQVVELEKQELPVQAQEQLPNAPSFVVVPKPQFVAFGQAAVECQAEREGLLKCQADVKDLTQQVKLTEEKAARWEQAAKGGTTAQKIFKVAVFSACAGGGAWAGAKLHKATGAAVMASGAVLGCAVALK